MMRFTLLLFVFASVVLASCASHSPKLTKPDSQPLPVMVLMQTSLGDVALELYPARAPVTVANFLAYVDQGLYQGASFYRVVYPQNDNNPLPINVIQGGVMGVTLEPVDSPIAPIAHESTQQSGLKHGDGAISMARGEPGTAQSEFFISLGENPVLDHGGLRNPDGLGFAVFGKVVKGLDVIKAIQQQPVAATSPDPYVKGQLLAEPVAILHISKM